MSMQFWPQSIIDVVARRRAIIVMGAGTSFHSTPQPGSQHPPDWRNFLENAASKLSGKPRAEAKRLVQTSEYLSACEVIKAHLGPDWPGAVNVAYGQQRLEPGQLHELIYALDLPITLTTNFDRVYQHAATKLSSATVKIKTYRDSDLALLAKGDDKSRVILKVHGSIDDVGSMIFTRSDYIKLRNEYPLFQKVMSSLAVTHTLIFVGCGLRDPDFVLMLEDLAAVSLGFGKHACLIDSKQSRELERVYADCYGLQCIRYKYDVTHSELPKTISLLVDAGIVRRNEMAASAQW